MKKAFDQTVRDLKRGVNKSVLKVPSIEQKVLDATSNEPWGPHGTLLADIAQASRNYHEYQMTMSILWKRLNDSGKNWRHVYKALTVLEYMVAHGSERVIEEIREHAYQIKTLADFQYIDSSGRDQGNNVRKKSQNLVVLVSDTERIHEVRQKAAANRDKFQNSSAGSMHRPGSHSNLGGYGDRYDDRYGSRDDERNGYGREREYSYRDDDRYGRYGDSYSREHEDRYGRDDDHRGRSHSVDGSQNGSRSRSEHGDDGQYSSSPSGQKIHHIYSEQNLSAPPSYEEVVGGVESVGSERSPNESDRNGETSAVAPKLSPPPASSSLAQATGTAPTPSLSPAPTVNNKEAHRFNEFDPRGSFPAAPTTSSGVAPTMSGNGEKDSLASLTDNSLALVPTTSYSSTTEVDTSNNFASGDPSQGFDDPFGDGPFKAIAPTDVSGQQQQSSHSVPPFRNASNSGPELPQEVSQNSAVATFPGETSTSSGDANIDILADIFPLPGHQNYVSSHPEYPITVNQALPAEFGKTSSLPDQPVPQPEFSQSGPTAHHTSLPAQSQHPSSLHGFQAQSGQLVMHPNFSSQFGQPAPQASFPNQSAQASLGQSIHLNAVPYCNYNMQSGGHNMIPEVSSAPTSQQNSTNFLVTPQPFQAPQAGSSALMASQPGFPSPATVSTAPPTKDKFETKSTVWTDTLSRGLVNLNISGAKTNPLSDIGVDFDALNRKEKRMEKPAATPMTSTIHMGKAMGSGSGIGRAGILRPASNPMMGAGYGMGMGMAGPRPGVYGAVNQQPMGMNMAPNMRMGMNTNTGMGAQMQHPIGFPPGSAMPRGYNPMTGTGNYGQNPYGGGYR